LVDPFSALSSVEDAHPERRSAMVTIDVTTKVFLIRKL